MEEIIQANTNCCELIELNFAEIDIKKTKTLPNTVSNIFKIIYKTIEILQKIYLAEAARNSELYKLIFKLLPS